MEENRTPEEIAAKKEALEKKKTTHRRFSAARRALKIGVIATIGLLGKPTETEAQGYRLEPVKTTQREAIYGSAEWAENQGFIRCTKLGRGYFEYYLNTHGRFENGVLKHRGYKGVWLNPETGRALVLPKDPIADRDITVEYGIDMLKLQQEHRDGPFKPSNVRGARTYYHPGWFGRR